MFLKSLLINRLNFRFLFLSCSLLVSVAPGKAQAPSSQPILRIETGTHTAMIIRVSVDAANRYLVTSSMDKTARVWDLASGQLLRVLRPPIGKDNEGKLYSVAISPDSRTVATGGWTGYEWESTNTIYLFDRESGVLQQRIAGIPNTINYLTFSADGRYLAAVVGSEGVRLYRTGDYTETGRGSDATDICRAADFDPTGKRLAMTCNDGFLRLYAIDENGALHLIAKTKTRGGKEQAAVRFSPDGERLAVGFLDKRNVEVLSGIDLEHLYTPDTKPYEISRFSDVGWTADGQKLFATGVHPSRSLAEMFIGIRIWDEAGRGKYRDAEAAPFVVSHAVALANNGIVYGVADGSWGVIDANGKRTRFIEPTIANNAVLNEKFLLSADGTEFQFSYERLGESLARFSVKNRMLTFSGRSEQSLNSPRVGSESFKLTDWLGKPYPKLNGRRLETESNEKTLCYAVAPNDERLLLGTTFHIRLYNRAGEEMWKVPVTAAVGVNVSGDNRFAVAALNDGTVRWYRMSDGKELLAFLPHLDRKRWVLWTPSGYYDASPDGEELIGWHVNNGVNQAADFFPIGVFRGYYYRPDIIAAVLQTSDEIAAVKTANEKAKRSDSQLSISKLLPPVIEVRSVSPGTNSSGKTITVSYNVRTPSGEPITSFKVLVDGRPANVLSEAKSKTTPSAAEITLRVPERDCEISLIAENRFTKSVPAKLRLKVK